MSVPNLNNTNTNTAKEEEVAFNRFKREEHENRFNLVMIMVMNHITTYYPGVDINSAKEQFNEILQKSPSGPISCFLKYVYINEEYRYNLKNKQEKFFLDDSRIEDPEVAKDKAIIDKIFSFRKTWNNFTPDTKDFILESMKCLVIICTAYIEHLD